MSDFFSLEIGSKAHYSTLGPVEVTGYEDRTGRDGRMARHVVLKALDAEVSIFVPFDAADRVLRPLVRADEALAVLAEPPPRPEAATGSLSADERVEFHMEAIKSGEFRRQLAVYRELKTRPGDLEFGERKILATLERRLAIEISLALDVSTDEAVQRLAGQPA